MTDLEDSDPRPRCQCGCGGVAAQERIEGLDVSSFTLHPGDVSIPEAADIQDAFRRSYTQSMQPDPYRTARPEPLSFDRWWAQYIARVAEEENSPANEDLAPRFDWCSCPLCRGSRASTPTGETVREWVAGRREPFMMPPPSSYSWEPPQPTISFDCGEPGCTLCSETPGPAGTPATQRQELITGNDLADQMIREIEDNPTSVSHISDQETLDAISWLESREGMKKLYRASMKDRGYMIASRGQMYTVTQDDCHSWSSPDTEGIYECTCLDKVAPTYFWSVDQPTEDELIRFEKTGDTHDLLNDEVREVLNKHNELVHGKW